MFETCRRQKELNKNINLKSAFCRLTLHKRRNIYVKSIRFGFSTDIILSQSHNPVFYSPNVHPIIIQALQWGAALDQMRPIAQISRCAWRGPSNFRVPQFIYPFFTLYSVTQHPYVKGRHDCWVMSTSTLSSQDGWTNPFAHPLPLIAAVWGPNTEVERACLTQMAYRRSLLCSGVPGFELRSKHHLSTLKVKVKTSLWRPWSNVGERRGIAPLIPKL